MVHCILAALLVLPLLVCAFSPSSKPSLRRKWLLGGRNHLGTFAPPNLRSRKMKDSSYYIYKQHIDHFSNSSDTFDQRYWYSNYYYKAGGPAFLMIEGEGEASSFWIDYEDIPYNKMARDHNAIEFILEHRFYGESQPFGDLSTPHLKYLSSRQALEDIAEFINAMTEKFGLQGIRWITFGGSYSGALSAWMRLKYPNLVYGAVATSGPVLAEVDFPEYLEVVKTALTEQSQLCADNFHKGIEKVLELMETESGRNQLNSVFSLCDSLNTANPDDITNFYSAIIGTYMTIVQYNRDNGGYFRYALTVERICSYHEDSSVDPLQQLGNVNDYVMPYFGEYCIDYDYQEGVTALKDTSVNSYYAAERAWYWQTCTEFGYYQTTNSPTAGPFFGNTISLRSYTQLCEQVYGSAYTEASIYAAINATNDFYGGTNYKGSRVAFPNGSWDPWHTLGVLKSNYPSYTAIYMKGTSHCADMYEPLDDDLDSLKTGRETIAFNVATWINS